MHDEPLLCAVIECNLVRVQELISLGTSPNVKGNNEDRPLHQAIRSNQSKILDYLLSIDDIDLNAKNKYGETPLFYAVKSNQLHLVKKLISRNADINLDDIYARTPLHISVKYPEMAHFLIMHGAELNTKDEDGQTPLYAAVDNACLETVCMLLYFNADANIPCNWNYTPFMRSICKKNVEIQNSLLDYVTDFDATTSEGDSTLSLALGSIPLVKTIVERGADVSNEFMDHSSIVCFLRFCNLEMFKILWPKIEYQPLDIYRSYLEVLLGRWKPQEGTNELPDFLRIIIESGNISPIFKRFNFTRLYITNEEIRKQKFELLLEKYPKITSELIYLYLCEGKPLCDELMCKIYELFGNCELFRICLHMDIDKSPYTINIKNINMGLLMYDPLLTVGDLKKLLLYHHNFLTDIRPFLPYIRILDNVASEKKKSPKLKELLGMSSLKELARNITRDQLVSKFHLFTSKKYHLFVQNMSINTIYKDILTFKKPVYYAE